MRFDSRRTKVAPAWRDAASSAASFKTQSRAVTVGCPRCAGRFLRVLAGALVIVAIHGVVTAADTEPPAAEASFQKEVRPIFEAKCARCHGAHTQKAGLSLSSVEGIEKGGESGPILDRESPEDSTLYEYVHERTMPPEGEGELSEPQIDLICRWIRQGAKLPSESPASVARLTQHDALPILLLRCAACHGHQRREAGLDIRSRASLLRGGKSGPALVPGHPEESLLLARIEAGEMPPHKKLAAYSVKPVTPNELKILTAWIASGAPEVDISPDVATDEPDPLVSDEDRAFWAFQPPRAVSVPKVRHADRLSNPIDAFVLARLEDRGLSLSPEADRRTLIRRVYFDLLGLPPTPRAVETFVSDTRPDAYRRLVDRLLDSPRYGERWGQFWLDLAGYADSEGVQNADLVRPCAWRYRDYVIRAFNADKPYDRFLLEQLAGDELAPYEGQPEVSPEIYDNLVATGFLRMTPDGTDAPITSFVPDRLEIIDDVIEVFSSSVLGLTIKCARCHTHKFDPLPQRDYYRLAAVFKGALDQHDWLTPNPKGKGDSAATQARRLAYGTAEEIQAWRAAGGKAEDQPRIRALWDRGEPSPTYILRRGNYLNRGPLVGPGVPSVLTDGKTPFDVKPPWPGAKKTGRRLALARWVTRSDHPLTARVMVNRVWKYHFGAGIVQTLDNFGKTGARPTHPKLLDWLAVRFVKDGWSIKSLHRLMMTSSVYRQSSAITAQRERLDPDNALLSRMPMRRMEGEVLRDSLLLLADRLDATPFGPPDALKARADGMVTVAPRRGVERSWRRSIYALKRRTQPLTLLQNFDLPQMNPNCTLRSESIVAPQALHLTNDALIRELAVAFAERLEKEAADDPPSQVELAFELATGRRPTPEKRRAAEQSLDELAATWLRKLPGKQTTLAATHELWIREIEPDRVFENDLISVWSRASTDGGRRFGLVEFDLSKLADLPLTAAHLELGVLDSSPLVQTAALIPPGIDRCCWNDYLREKADSAQPLSGLGRVTLHDATAAVGTYVTSESATKDDLEKLQSVARAGGKLTLVLMAAEDGTRYRQDWDDGAHGTTRSNPPRLVVSCGRPDPEAARHRALVNLCHALLNSAALLYID